MAAPKTITISIRVPIDLRRELEAQAKIKGMSLSRYLVEEIYLGLNKAYAHCPRCKKPVADMRYMDNAKIIGFECPWCGYEWEVEDDEF